MIAFRLPFVGLFGVVVAAGLFHLLAGFVGEPIKLDRATTVARLPNVRVDSRPLDDRRKPIEKPERTDRPSMPGLPGLVVEGPPAIKGMTGIPKIPRGEIGIGRIGPRLGGGGSDGDAAPLVRVLPQYPPHLRGRNVEGWVRVRFTVAADGTVKDARVVASEPAKDFDTAALAAVSRWRYRPRVENGAPVERVGLETILRFELE